MGFGDYQLSNYPAQSFGHRTASSNSMKFPNHLVLMASKDDHPIVLTRTLLSLALGSIALICRTLWQPAKGRSGNPSALSHNTFFIHMKTFSIQKNVKIMEVWKPIHP